jgi:hypothetical protein
MNPDRLAQVLPLVRKVLLAPPSLSLCATFEVVGHDEIWIQVTNNSINLAYPAKEDPQTRLAQIANGRPCTGILDWEPTTFVTLSYASVDPQAVAKVVDALFEDFFGLADCAVDGRLESL